MAHLLLFLALTGCTAATVSPGCSMERTATVKVACTEKAKDNATTVTVPMPSL